MGVEGAGVWYFGLGGLGGSGGLGVSGDKCLGFRVCGLGSSVVFWGWGKLHALELKTIKPQPSNYCPPEAT